MRRRAWVRAGAGKILSQGVQRRLFGAPLAAAAFVRSCQNCMLHALTSEEELEDDEDGVTGAEGTERTVGTREHVGNGLAEGDHDAWNGEGGWWW